MTTFIQRRHLQGATAGPGDAGGGGLLLLLLPSLLVGFVFYSCLLTGAASWSCFWVLLVLSIYRSCYLVLLLCSSCPSCYCLFTEAASCFFSWVPPVMVYLQELLPGSAAVSLLLSNYRSCYLELFTVAVTWLYFQELLPSSIYRSCYLVLL